MEAGIITRIEAGLAEYRLSLHPISIVNKHTSANGDSIGFDTFQFHLEPVSFPTAIVAQQRRRLIQVHDENVHIAIVIEVSKSTATTAMPGDNSEASRFH